MLKPLLCAACALVTLPAYAADCPTGTFRVLGGADVASMLEIAADGSFRYILSAGAVDEQAQGRWTCADGVVKLTTTPEPKPAEFKLDKVETGGEAPFSLLVSSPDGNGIAGVDFRIEFDAGEPAFGYTQQYGWTLDALDGRKLKTVQLAEPFYGTVSPVFPIPEGNGITMKVTLVPNDMGTAAFKDTLVTREGDKVMLHWRDSKIPYIAQTP